MKASVHRTYGSPDVLTIEEVETPRPDDDEVLIQTFATTVSSGDWRARSLEMPPGFGPFARLAFGVFGPRQPILGTELSGRIVEVGEAVEAFEVGDAVFAFPGAKMGCHAEYRCMPENGAIARKPGGVTYAQAAALSFGGTTALHFLRKAEVQPGETVLVNGASGSVGTAAVQLAKHLGAEVTGVCSTRNLELVASLGADHVIDYTQEDVTTTGQRYDVILDTAGTAGYARSKGALADGGRLLLVLGGLGGLLGAPWVSWTTDKKVIAGPAAERAEDLIELAELAEAGTFEPVIDRTYPFEQIAEAHRYVDTGRKRGNVVVTVADPEAEAFEAPDAPGRPGTKKA